MGIIVLILAVFGILTPFLFSGGWPLTHEPGGYLFQTDFFREAFLAGHGYPRWIPDMFGGYGYPRFVFYQPGFYFINLLFSFLPGYPLVTIKIAVLALFLIGALGAYFLAREITSGRASWAPALLFIITPYLFMDLHIRGDLSELAGILVTPWPVYLLLRAKRKFASSSLKALDLVWLTLSLGAVIFMHPAVAFFFFGIHAVLTVTVAWDLPERGKFIGLVFLATLTAVVMSAPYWEPIMVLKNTVSLCDFFKGAWSPINNLIQPERLFSRVWGYGTPQRGDEPMSFQLGLPHFMLACAGAFLARKDRFFVVVFILYLFCIFLVTPASAFVWKCLPVTHFVQFPWRILSVVAVLQMICITGVFGIRTTSVKKTFVLLQILLVIILVRYYSDALSSVNIARVKDWRAEIRDCRDHIRRETLVTFDAREFLLKWQGHPSPPFRHKDDRMAVVLGEGLLVPEKDNSKFNLHYKVTSPKATKVMINQVYFPGWRIIVDGQDLTAAKITSLRNNDGRMTVDIGQGTVDLKAFYDGPPGWRIVLAGAVILTAGLIFLMWFIL